MHATEGDWLIVKSHTDSQQAQRAKILSVGPDGAPPYRVRWVSDGHEGLVFPGPDAEVVSAATLAELDAAAERRVAAVQTEIAHQHH